MEMEDFKQEFSQIKEKMEQFVDDYKKKLLFLGLINKYLKESKSKIVILGGFAVQFYTAGEYITKDIDLACNNRNALKKLLIASNFKVIGRHFYSDELDIAIEVPTSSITSNEEQRLKNIELEGYDVFILGIEDIIIDRINAFVHWKSLDDGRLAKELIFIHFKELDWKYLEMRAREEESNAELQKIKDEIQKEREKNENKL